MSEHSADISVFSRQIEAASVSPRATERQLEAGPAERTALAEVLELQAIDRLVATLHLRRLASGLVEVTGDLESEVVQTCVITLEPVPAQIREHFRLTFGDAEPEPALSEIDIHFDDSDPPEPIVDGKIDLGALVAEQLSLALDPYPRKEGAVVPEEFAPSPAEIHQLEAPAATRKPFAGLDKLKK
ncbi:YceD family protein [Dongia rigui]|uniref:DUF177 domain-containing protein n=1 Tax=Dongia rigui TaxID=940149 RepID=A0ABU5E2H5_9PROT|nr:DUF177 domain-containing protein [Dongia rigui]MDY0873093.1 DUF177 domain-containing protein [Dongia rigui]